MKLICAGNRYVHPDGAALWLYDQAITQDWPDSVTWVEGGLGGLNLLPHFEHADSVILIDHMPERANAELATLDQIDPHPPTGYRHDTALRYLLHALPRLMSKPPPVLLMACNPDTPGWQAACLDCVRSLIRHGH